jgi:hypothetical protein
MNMQSSFERDQHLRLMFAVRPQGKWSRIKGMAIRSLNWLRRIYGI